MKKKYYAVKVGRKPGIYLTWNECRQQVDGYKGAKYKGFAVMEEAVEYLEESKSNIEKNMKVENIYNGMIKEKIYAFVDGSYNQNTDTVGYGLVLVKNNKVCIKDLGSFRNINFNESKHIFGEIRGALKAVEIAIANNLKEINIIHDYNGLSKLANGEWKAKTGVTIDYQDAMSRYKKLININFIKIKSHSNNKYNDIADNLAKIGSKL